MITEHDINLSVQLLRELGASRIILFGSAAICPADANDIDLAYIGLRPDQHHRALGVLLESIGKPIDLIDLENQTQLVDYIISQGRVLYDG